MTKVRMVRGEAGKPAWKWIVTPEGVPGLEGSYTLTAAGSEVSDADARFLCNEVNAEVLGGREFEAYGMTPDEIREEIGQGVVDHVNSKLAEDEPSSETPKATAKSRTSKTGGSAATKKESK